MRLDGRAGLSIVELIFYIPMSTTGFYLCWKHSFSRSSGWIFILLLCLVRGVGSVINLVTYSSPSVGLYQAVATMDAIGISPLLLATLGLISRL